MSFALLIFFSNSLTHAEDWPQFLGPDRNGISKETKWRSNWSEKDVKISWKAEVGIGFSSMSVKDGRFFTMGHRAGNDLVYCLNAETGKEIWKYKYKCKIVDNLHEGGPAATPTIDGDRVYTLSKEGHIFCFNAKNGDVIWEKYIPKFLKAKMPEWGFSASALVLGDKVIFDGGPLFALNKKDGSLIWKTKKKYTCGYGSAIYFKQDKQGTLACLNNDGLILADPNTGKVHDLYTWPTQYQTNSTTPLFLNDGTIFISTAYNKGCALLKVKNNKLVRKYENRNMRNHMNNSIPYKDYLFGYDGKAHRGSRVPFVCINRKTGEVMWKKMGMGCGSVIRAGDRLILFSDKGELVIAKASEKEFKELARKHIIYGRTWTSPILANGRIYVRNARGNVACVDVR